MYLKKYFLKDEWKSDQPFPDLRILIIEPSTVTNKSLQALSASGWGICRVPRLEYFKVVLEFWKGFKERKLLFRLIHSNWTQWQSCSFGR